MKLRRTIRLLALVFGMVLAHPAWAQVSFRVFSGPGTYCPTNQDQLMGDAALQVINNGTVPSGSGFVLNLPAPLSTTAAPTLSTSPAVANVSLTVSGQSLTVSFSASVNLSAGTIFQIVGIRLDVTKISGNQAVVTFSASGSTFSFSNGSAAIGTADPNLCPVTLALSGNSVTFRTIPGTTVFQQLSLSSTNGQSFAAPVLNVAMNDGGAWLSATANGSGSSTYSITITVQPSSTMTPGSYTGSVTLTVANATNSPLSVNVSLVVLQPTPQVSETLLAFRTTVGVDPPTKKFTVTGAGNLTVTTQLQSPAGGTWLTFTKATTGKDPSTNQDIVTVTVAPKAAGLASALTPYIGFVLVTAEQSAGPTGVLIQLYVDQGSQIALDQSQLSFPVAANSTATVTQNVTIKNGGSGTLAWTAQATTDRGGSWLSVNPTSGSGDTAVAITVNPTGLASGAYTGAVQFTATSATNSPQRVAVTLMVGTVPAIASRGIKNGASFSDGTAAAGTILSIFGSNLASSAQSAQTVPLPTLMGGAQVKVNGTPAPLYFVSPGQINFQLPPDVSGASVSIVVSRENVDGLAVSIPLVSALPGLFSLSSDGSGPGAILKSDFSVVSATNPAARGSVVLIYGSGMGPVNPTIPAGQAAPSNPLSTMVLTPSVTIGGVQARVVFAGLAPGFVGLYQINVEVPSGVSPGSVVPVVISVNSAASNTVTLAVQ